MKQIYINVFISLSFLGILTLIIDRKESYVAIPIYILIGMLTHMTLLLFLKFITKWKIDENSFLGMLMGTILELLISYNVLIP